METFREFLLRKHNNIICQAKGTCCPDRCQHKTSEGKCRNHPSVIGRETRNDLRCTFTPMEIAANCGIACPPAVRRIESIIGEKIIINENQGRYQGQPMIERKQHDKIMEREVT